ncbi:MAG: DegT/DnrJ/EryC1/StrS family aminotransferase, partial [Planctomycetes bacterium]|nr:DegT/DnrJ/EryC1/StrS family aminotransferase [Planctomycetota bacterium]
LNALAAAVVIEQMKRVDTLAAKRNRLGSRLDSDLAKIEGIWPRPVRKGDYATYWFYIFRIDTDLFGVTNSQFVEALNAEGIWAQVPHTMNVMNWSLFRNDTDDHHACSYHCPLYKGPRPDYDTANYPGIQQVCREGIELLMSPNFTIGDMTDVGRAVAKVARYYAGRKS